MAATVANWAAQLDFQKARFTQLEMPEWQQQSQLDVDKFAYQKAQDTWENAYKEAMLTGTYQGQPTIEWLTQQAQLTGVFNGQETLQGKLTDAQINQMNQQMKLANDEFLANTTGYYNGQATFDRQKWEAEQGMAGWQFVSTLSGAPNAFKQARAIGSTPEGLRQMMGQFSGQFMTPGTTSIGPGSSPETRLTDLMLGAGGNYAPAAAPVSTGAPAPTAAPAPAVYGQPAPTTPAPMAAAATPYTYSPAGVQAPVEAWNYSPTLGGNTQVYPPGVASPAMTPDASTSVPVPAGSMAPAVSGAYQYPAAVPGMTNVNYGGTAATGALLPNQINAEGYNNSYDYQKDLLWASFEDQGYDKGLSQEGYKKSLPTYSGPTSGKISAF